MENCGNSYDCEECCKGSPKATLQNEELWKKFHDLQTEMIITKSGRRMFPTLRVLLKNLDPTAHYCVLLEMTPASNCRYKYSAARGWVMAGAEEAHSPHRLYLHPESPATGEHWMSQPVSFSRMKLTNTPNPPHGHLVLLSMHKYQPRIVIAKTVDPRTITWAPTTSIVFEETQFIAVTAYQNEKITQLKIDNNPFAKGFRENGQSKCKRKWSKEQAPKSNTEIVSTPSPAPSSLTTTTPPPPPTLTTASDDTYVLPPSVVGIASPSHLSTFKHLSLYQHSTYHHQLQYPLYNTWQTYYYAPYYKSAHKIQQPQDLTVHLNKKPKKLTDFSITAIMGLL